MTDRARAALLADGIADVLVFAHLVGLLNGQEAVADAARFADEGAVPASGFARALAWLRSRVALVADDFAALTDRAKRAAFTMAEVFEERTVGRVRDHLARVLEKGGTLDQFTKRIDRVFDDVGISEARPWHAEVVFRNGWQTTYQAANRAALESPGAAGHVVAYRYVTLDDSRVRPAHAEMHGTVRPVGDPLWDTWWPPNGHNCRCTVVPVFDDEVRDGSERLSRDVPGVSPDEGWATSPEVI